LSDLAPLCLSCGVCCFSRLEAYVRVEGADHARLGESAGDLTHFIGNRCYMIMAEGHCAALVIDATTGLFVCSVYTARPSVCRTLKRSSSECRAEIHEKGERPAASLHVLRSTR
jgi:Fe-S-cluster containining protein